MINFICLASSSSFAQLNEITDFGSNPGNLRMHIYVPDTLDTEGTYPLVIALHGCSQKVENMARQSGWNELADQHQFIVVYPEQKRSNNWSKCFNWFRKKDIDASRGELASIKSMVDYTFENYHIDTSEIYSYGLSAGAMMSVSLLATFPKLFNAGAVFAGGPYKVATNGAQGMRVLINPKDESPEYWKEKLVFPHEEPPRLFVYHGEQDRVVDIQNAYELVEQWTAWNTISHEPSSVDTSFTSSDITLRTYQDVNQRTGIMFLSLANIGHELAVDPGQGEKQGGEEGAYASDIGFFSTYYVWQFFNQESKE